MPLRRVYDDQIKSGMSPADYLQLLEDTLADKLENNYDGRFKIPQIVEMSGARIPADALAKVQRRFGLLDRGPGLVRQGGLKKPARRKSV